MEDHARHHEQARSMLDWALWAVARGWWTFPAQEGRRRPATRHGVKDATSKSVPVRQWWQHRPNMNPAIACGPSGLVVLDCDDLQVKGSGDGHGLDELQQLAEQHGDPADLDTFTVRSPLAGAHLYYVAPPGVTIKPTAGVLASGVDVRAGNAYVLGPGARLNDERALFGSYTILDGRDPRPLPGWLEQLLTANQQAATVAQPSGDPYELMARKLEQPDVAAPDKYAAAVLQGECAEVRGTSNGTRNQRLYRAAIRVGTQVTERGLDARMAGRELVAAGVACGLPESESRAAVRSAYKYLGIRVGGGRA